MPTGGDKRSTSKYSVGWPVLVMRHIEESARRDTIDSFTSNAILVIQPRRLTNPPSNGDHPVFLNPIPLFVCPSSELGSASPDSTTSELPEVKAREQGALHYRGVEGRYERPEDLSLAPEKQPYRNNTNEPGKFSQQSWYARNGTIVPGREITFRQITDGTSKTLLLGETSSANGRPSPDPAWGGINPWTWGYYYYGTATSEAAGWLTIDHKLVRYPIGYTGAFFANETPFTSAHAGGGAHVAYCDGSVEYLMPETSIDVLELLASRDGGEMLSTN
jgi:prepilin-type processing-associated H-X9-DG protein